MNDQAPKFWKPIPASQLQPAADNTIPWGQLIDRHPTLQQPLIEGLLRRGETMNVIANSKARKSWLLVDLAVAIAHGRPWLGKFPTPRAAFSSSTTSCTPRPSPAACEP